MTTTETPPHRRGTLAATDDAGQLAVSMTNMAELMKHPTLALPADPPDLRMWAGKLWMMVECKMPTARPICFSLANWIGDYGLRADDALALLKRLCHPAKLASFKFPGDIEQALAFEANKAIEQREHERVEAANRAAAERAKAVAEADRAKVKEMLGYVRTAHADFGRMPA